VTYEWGCIGHDVSESIFKFHRTFIHAISALKNRGYGDGERDKSTVMTNIVPAKLQTLPKSSTLVANTHPKLAPSPK